MRTVLAVFLLLLLNTWCVLLPQDTQLSKDAPLTEKNISLNFPENTEIKLLIDYVSDRLRLNILYDKSISGKTVTLLAPAKIPEEALFDILLSALRMNGMTLVPQPESDWYKVVSTSNLQKIGTIIENGNVTPSVAVITKIVTPKYVSVRLLADSLREFLSEPGGNLIIIESNDLLVISDHLDVIQKIDKMISYIDTPREPPHTEFYQPEHVDPSQLVGQVERIFAAKYKDLLKSDPNKYKIEILVESRSNQVFLIGKKPLIEEALELARSLDLPRDIEYQFYRLHYTDPERVAAILSQTLSGMEKENYSAYADKDGGFLVVTGPVDVHKKVEKLCGQIDVPPRKRSSPIRFYKLSNADAEEVLNTLFLIRGEEGGDVSGSTISEKITNIDMANGKTVPDSHTPDNTLKPIEGGEIVLADEFSRVMADKNTNTIIVVGSPAAQEIYKELIYRLDCRRPQVLIEVILVAIDTSEGYSLGVDLSRQSVSTDDRYLLFSTYGLSNVDPATGALSMNPATGFNGALLGNEALEIVLQALKTDGRSEVVSAPRLLVNDNSTGTLSTVFEVPYTSINASNTVSTTSFSGFSSAGTTISITPHISDGNYLKLDYSINLSTFSGEGSNGIPPPRQTDEVQSDVTIPNGDTIVIGGLNRTDSTSSRSGVPVLSDIPLLGWLFGRETQSRSETSLFVFIRPTILRDEDFSDLKYISSENLNEAGIDDGYPKSEPLEIH